MGSKASLPRPAVAADDPTPPPQGGPSLSLVEVSVDAAARLQLSLTLLTDRIHSLPRRFGLSSAALIGAAPQVPVAVRLMTARREAIFDCGVLASEASKALESAAEEARVAAAQLGAYAMLLEEAEDEEEGASVDAAACALLSYSVEVAPRFVVVTCDCAPLCHAIAACMHVRDGIDPLRCTVSGAGLYSFQGGDQCVSVCAMDVEGEAVGSVEAEDVCVSVSVEGIPIPLVLISAQVSALGVVDVMYRVQECCGGFVELGLSVCGVALLGSPWIVTSLLEDSAVLASVAPEPLAAFLREFTVNWLPRRAYRLLYRGSRDGMTAAAFHGLCDGKGPTLVLVRCDEGFVFGGYAGASWESPPSGKKVASPDAFVFSVVGPHTTGPVRFPVMARNAHEALHCSAGCGPVFISGFSLATGGYVPTFTFDGTSSCAIGYGGFENVLGKWGESLTGSISFFPREVEVFAAKRT